MAEIVVNFLVNKLCDAVFQEIFFLCGVNDKVEHVKRELIRIQCFLKDADRKRGGDERVRNWVNELRNMSHWIEDTVELFVLEVGESSGEYPGTEKLDVKKKIMRFFKKTEKPVIIHKFGKEIDNILAQITEIAESRVKYGIENLGENGGTEVVVSFKRPILPGLDDTELVGVGAEKDNIIEQLLDARRLRRSVVSIVGPGGLGKSTVAEKAYSSDKIKGKFDVRMWISISQTFTLINLLKKILQGLNIEKDGDEEYLLIEVNKLLREKKYLIVMDDVWSENLWLQISPALPDAKNGSRVLITSRFSNVPKAADPASEPYELRLVNEQESLELLQKTALPNLEVTDQHFLTDTLDIAKQLAHKCDGLPLALVAMGGILSVKPSTYHAWEKVLKTMEWSVDGKSCMDILASSYDDMSVDLKTCFMYLACFPEDHKIDAEDLIRLWVAEGFIPHISNRTLEDTADDYLEQLVQRSMVQVLERGPCGSIKQCRLHDLMRDIALKKAEEENFLTVCSNGDVERSCGRARRVAVDHSDCEVMKYASPNLHSFLCFKELTAQNLSGHRLLKVFRNYHANIWGINTFETKSFDGWSTQLRYLKLDGRLHKSNEQQFIMHKILGGTMFLQTIDLRNLLGHGDLPSCVWYVKTLRHLLLAKSIPGPPPSAELRELQTLSGVRVPESWELNTMTFPNIPNLRTLRIEKIESNSRGVLVAFLHTLKNLISLTLRGDDTDILIKVADFKSFPFYPHLKYLCLAKKFSISHDPMCEPELIAAMFPTHLIALKLHLSGILSPDPMAVLEKLKGVRNLDLDFEYVPATECSPGGFSQLQYLVIRSNYGIQKWNTMKGAMPVLKELTIYSDYMPVPHGLRHLTTLRVLKWIGYCNEEKKQEIREICAHVPSIVFSR